MQINIYFNEIGEIYAHVTKTFTRKKIVNVININGLIQVMIAFIIHI